MPENAAREPTSRGGGFAGRGLALGAIALLLFGALIPIFGVGPDRGFQILVMLALITAILGGMVAPQGSTVTFMLLWAAFGMSAAIGTIGFFSIGLLYLIAAIFLLFAIFATPNHSDIARRYDWRYVIAFCAGFLSIVIPMFA